MKIPFEFELLLENADEYTWYEKVDRAKVIGGWIIRSQRDDSDDECNNKTLSESMVFVPDPQHEWIVDND